MGVERILRLPVSVDAGGGDAGGGNQFRGRYPLAAGQCAAGGAVCGDGASALADCPEPGNPWRGVFLVGMGPDRHCGADCVRGRYEHHQLYGRHQRHHGGLLAGGAGAAGVEEWHRGVREREPDCRGDSQRAGVQLVQLPAEEQG